MDAVEKFLRLLCHSRDSLPPLNISRPGGHYPTTRPTNVADYAFELTWMFTSMNYLQTTEVHSF